MDFGTLIGILIGFGLIFGSIALGPEPMGFLDLPSAMIVFGGVFAATLISFPLEEVIQAFKACAKDFFKQAHQAEGRGGYHDSGGGNFPKRRAACSGARSDG